MTGTIAMRQLIGKIATKDRNIVEEVYLSEQVRCRDCQKTVPLGIEVVAVQKGEKSKKILNRVFFAARMVPIMYRVRRGRDVVAVYPEPGAT